MHTDTHTLDWLIFCLAGRWVCQFKVAASICKWLYCLTLARLCSMDQVLRMRASPGDQACLTWPSRPIPAGRKKVCVCSVDVSQSNVIHSSEAGVSVEIIGMMTAADSGDWKILTPSPPHPPWYDQRGLYSTRLLQSSWRLQNAGAFFKKREGRLNSCLPIRAHLSHFPWANHHSCSFSEQDFIAIFWHLLF